MIHPLAITALVALATWDAWRWYLLRLWTEPEQAGALVLTVAFIGIVGFVRRRELARASEIVPADPIPLALVALLLLGYAVSYLIMPPIVRAAVAVALTLACLHSALFRERPPIAFWGMVALALPVLPSLQMTFGYPMRVISASLTVGLLQAHGLMVARQGTFLVWREEMVQFDAPCSGVNMLWAALLLAFMGCVLFRFSVAKVIVAIATAVVLAIAANVLRASSLFYVEAGFIASAPGWWHDAIGLVSFAMAAAAMLWLLDRMRTMEMPRWPR